MAIHNSWKKFDSSLSREKVIEKLIEAERRISREREILPDPNKCYYCGEKKVIAVEKGRPICQKCRNRLSAAEDEIKVIKIRKSQRGKFFCHNHPRIPAVVIIIQGEERRMICDECLIILTKNVSDEKDDLEEKSSPLRVVADLPRFI